MAGNPAGEYVVKLTGAMERGVAGHLCELIASRVATELGVMVPVPAIVMLDEAFVRLVADARRRENPLAAERIGRSAGLNFGSKQLTGVATWPTDRELPAAQRQAAAEIFAFDALIENPDRGFRNPNLFTAGDDLIVFDHETAFSFLLDVLPTGEPWKLARTPYLSDHVFFHRLRGKVIDLERFESALAALDGGLVADVPEEWNNGDVERIYDHLRGCRDHAGEFVEAVRRRLA